jgi:hypothetical protein
VLVEAVCGGEWTTVGTTDSEGSITGSALPEGSVCANNATVRFRLTKTGYLTNLTSTGGIHNRLYYTTANNNYPLVITPVVPTQGSDYRAEYWNTGTDDAWEPEFPATDPILSTTTTTIDSDWLNGSPAPTISVDGFMARFTKTAILAAGNYTFNINGDDGTRVYVDGSIILDTWGGGTNDTTTFISEGLHIITVEYYEGGGSAHISFSYSATDVVDGAPSNVYEMIGEPTPPDSIGN